MVNGVVIIIPAYNPDEKFIDFLKDLYNDGWKDIIVVDDGSKSECQKYFDIAAQQYGCQLVRHYINLGKGRAFKSAFNYFLGHYGKDPSVVGVVKCDCDGQHILEDVNKCAELLKENPEKIVLGVRDFDREGIPLKSRLGNKITRFVFKYLGGLDITDTQTGLRGIPAKYLPAFIELQGERYEYESGLLLETKPLGIEIIQFPIHTIYINGNETSHFNPVADSIRIYSVIFKCLWKLWWKSLVVFLKYIVSSLSASVIDIGIFALCTKVLLVSVSEKIVISTAIARVISATYNYLVNRNIVFKSDKSYGKTSLGYLILCICQMLCSAIFVRTLVGMMQFDEVVVKMIVDGSLFFISYLIQKTIIFKKEKLHE